jgi:phenylacetate-CoA ligase
MRDLDGVASYRFVIDRVAHRDELRCEVVPEPGAPADEVVAAVKNRVKSALRFTTEVEIATAIDDDDTIVDRRIWHDS